MLMLPVPIDTLTCDGVYLVAFASIVAWGTDTPLTDIAPLGCHRPHVYSFWQLGKASLDSD